VIVIVFAALGFLSPAYRGGLVQATVLTFLFLGSTAGYTSARFYKFFKGDDWKATTFLTGTVFPGATAMLFVGMDLMLWGHTSAGAVPIWTLFVLLLLWFGISVPLVFLGAYFGYRAPVLEVPTRTNSIMRHVPKQPWFIHPVLTAMVGGVLPFGAVFTELFFIMASIWQHRFYYLFGFLILVFVILVVTCAEISIAFTYFQLTSEDYHWWWRSFAGSAFSGVYVFLYAILYFVTKLEITKGVSMALYFGYMGFISLTFMFLTGAVGALASFAFVRAIFGSIKID
jgi:transmembrane 9 superfamily protein 2/4